MSWLTPLGFLGFIGLLVLLIIYLLKPNYQNKFISSTYVWKLSLKYKKKKMPLSKLRNILLIICQILIVCSCAFILAQPFIEGEDLNSSKEKIFVIDGSGSMLAKTDGETRFERAVYKVKTDAEDALKNGGKVSVIVAGRSADFVIQRLGEESQDSVISDIEALAGDIEGNCSYGNADIDGAMALAEQVLLENAKAEVRFYTGTTYVETDKVTVVPVSDENEHNVALLDLKAVIEDNIYYFELTAASYGKNFSGTITVNINGAYGTYGAGSKVETYSGQQLSFSFSTDLVAGEPRKLTFGNNENYDVTDLKIREYESVTCLVQIADAISTDNTYYLFGGTPQPIRIQYYTAVTNNFTSGILMTLRDIYKQDWKIQIDEILDSWQNINSGNSKEEEIKLEGYHIYIFEHHIPKELPEDGLVILINPDTLPKGTDFKLGNQRNYDSEPIIAASDHPLLDYLPESGATINSFRPIDSYDGDYEPILTADGHTIAIAKNTPTSKTVVFSFNPHHSTLFVDAAFPILFMNIVDYYMPTTFDKDVYELYDEVILNSRSETLEVTGPGFETTQTFTSFPASIHVNAPGTYTVTQIPLEGGRIVEKFSVVIPAEQSDITREVASLTNPYHPPIIEPADLDLVLYFAIALVSLLFIEWWLKSRDN